MQIHTQRVQRLMAAMREDSILLLPAAPAAIRNRDTFFPYRASSDILYLTGVNEEKLSLLITKDALHIFAQERDVLRERWVGYVKGHEYFHESFATLGVDVKVHGVGRFETEFREQVKNKKFLYYDTGFAQATDTLLLGILAELAAASRRGVYVPDTIIRASSLLAELRLFKDASDLTHLRRAAAIAASAHNKARELIHATHGELSEFQVKALIEHEFMAAGADRLAYPSIVAAGANATILHYEGTAGTANSGDFILIDAGCEVEGYASDITRTSSVGNSASPLQRDLHALVLSAQRAAIAAAVSGTTIDAVHAAAVDILSDGLLSMGFFKSVPKRKAGEAPLDSELVNVTSRDEIREMEYYNLFYMHRTSHYLGLDVHDVGDYYEQGKSRALQPNMVITVEPGLYFPREYHFIADEARGIGIRIEDDVLVTADGNEVLTSACLS
ncbi:MAG: aminopeptidase P N-terminal domain-containing protein [Spirochaetes bacterium]|nr:aminopeptidase P N-terminal domain-containing protein [Spirochaetota bacterium]